MTRLGREHERIDATVPVRLEGGGEGKTLNISPQGLFFVTDESMAVGNSIRFTMEFTSHNLSYYLDCVGEIVRMEEVQGKRGVGVRITSSKLERQRPGGEAVPKGEEAISAG
jgi:hypothetical protein